MNLVEFNSMIWRRSNYYHSYRSKLIIESLPRTADGSVTAPASTVDMAYWVEGANVNYVFALSPSPGNLALKNRLQTGDAARIVWADCGSEE